MALDLEEPKTANGDNAGGSQPARASWSRQHILLIIAGLTVLVLLIAVGAIPRVLVERDLKRQQAHQAATAPNVFVMLAQGSSAALTLQLSGTTSSITEAPVLARTDGYLKRRLVDIGDTVHAGQLLAVIEAPDLDQQVQQANALLLQSRSALGQTQAGLNQANANAGIAGITAERWGALVKKGAVSRQANDNYQFAYTAQVAAVDVATANVAAANNTVSSNAANVGRYREMQGFEQVRAPFDGVITQRNVDEGALVTATNTLLFRVAKNGALRTYIDVPQIDAPSMKVGDAADLTFVQHPGRVFHGKVTRTADSLNLNTRTLLTEVDVDNKDGILLPGMYATVTFSLPRTLTAILIPSEALVFRADGTTVAIVDGQHTIHFQRIVIGQDFGDTLEVASGLQAGQAVVVNPNDTAVEGARVNPIIVNQASGSLAPASPPTPAAVNKQPGRVPTSGK